MASIRIPRPWELPEPEATPESAYLDRRRFLKALGFVGAGAVLSGSLMRAAEAATGVMARPAAGGAPAAGTSARGAARPLYPAARDARFVRTVSFLKPDEAPNQELATWYHWPYYEALRMDEAMNELAFLAFGIYGHDLPVQHGAPARLVTPWKYGYKSAKAIARFEFTDRQPKTFWNDAAPAEYGFLSNVNPKVPHPRWSQATETMIGTNEKRPTLPYNGYVPWVAHLYHAKTLTYRS